MVPSSDPARALEARDDLGIAGRGHVVGGGCVLEPMKPRGDSCSLTIFLMLWWYRFPAPRPFRFTPLRAAVSWCHQDATHSLNDRLWAVLLKNSVFGGAQKIAVPQRLRSFLGGGRRDFVLRATKIVLTEPAAIRGSNSRPRSKLARNCDGYIFEFFNRIVRERTRRKGDEWSSRRR